jgi:hypothetical protein
VGKIHNLFSFFKNKLIFRDESESSEGDYLEDEKNKRVKTDQQENVQNKVRVENNQTDIFGLTKFIVMEGSNIKPIAHFYVFRNKELELEPPNVEFDRDGWGCKITVKIAARNRSFKQEILSANEIVPEEYRTIASAVYNECSLYKDSEKTFFVKFPMQINEEVENGTMFDWAVIYLLRGKSSEIRKPVIIKNRSNQPMDDDMLNGSIIINNDEQN